MDQDPMVSEHSGKISDVFPREEERAKQNANVLRLMVSLNTLGSLHMHIDSAKSKSGDEYAVLRGWEFPLMTLAAGVLAEGLASLKDLGKSWFEEIESQLKEKNPEEYNRLPVPGCEKLWKIVLAGKKEGEWRLIRRVRDRSSFHWNRNALSDLPKSAGDEELPFARVQILEDKEKHGPIQFVIAEVLQFAAGYGIESFSPSEFKGNDLLVKDVVSVRGTMTCYIKVVGAYLIAYMSLRGVTRNK